MAGKCTVLIITDEAESTNELAVLISAACSADCSVRSIAASELSGTDLLPVRIFFIGAGSPKPASFEYLEDLLKHINLAGRSCGLFSPSSSGTVDYLSALVKDCEAFTAEPFVGDKVDKNALSADIKAWVQGVLKSRP